MSYAEIASELLNRATEAESLTGTSTWQVSHDPEIGWVVQAGENVWIALLGPDQAAEFLANLIAQVSSPSVLKMLAAWLVALSEFQDADVVPPELQESTAEVVAAFLGE